MLEHPFASVIIRAVLVTYAVWGAVAVIDLGVCEAKRPGQCEASRSELRGAATTIPGTLLAWLADSPLNGKTTSYKTSNRSRSKTDEENV
jgi:hypothetical protein